MSFKNALRHRARKEIVWRIGIRTEQNHRRLPGPRFRGGGSVLDPSSRDDTGHSCQEMQVAGRWEEGRHRRPDTTTHRVTKLFRRLPMLGMFFAACTSSPLISIPSDSTNDAADASQDALAWPDDAWLWTLPLETTATGASGWSDRKAFAVPPGTTALTITLTAQLGHTLQLAEMLENQTTIVPATWIADAGQPWLYADGQERVRAAPWQATFLLPNAPQVPILDGLLQLRAYAFDYDYVSDLRAPTATTLQVEVELVRKTPQQAQTGRLDLNLCLTGARGITAANALTHPRVQAALAVVKKSWQQAGIQLGEVRVFDVPSQRLTVTHDDGADLEMVELFALAKDQPPGIPLFLLEAVNLQTHDGLIPAAGFTGGIPAPHHMGGPRTGIALALKYDQPDTLGVIMAHEIGHFLGLFHVVEVHAPGETPIEDALADTAPTPANLMYNTPDPAHLELTPQQGIVVRSGPWVTPL